MRALDAQARGADPFHLRWTERAVERLFELGLVNLRVCEQRAIRGEIERLAAEGVPRCEAMHATAELFCCSYEKIRNYYYNSYKS